MKKLLIALLLIILICSCKKNENSFYNKNNTIDSVAIYLKQHDLNTNKALKIKQLDKAVEYIFKLNIELINNEDLLKIYESYYLLKEPKKFRSISMLLKKRAILKNDSKLLGFSYNCIANYYKFKDERNVDSSYYYFNKAEKVFIKENMLDEYYSNLTQTAPLIIYNNYNLFAVEKKLLKSLNYYLDKNDYENICRVYIILGFNYSSLKEFEKARNYFFKAVELQKKNKFKLNKFNECFVGITVAFIDDQKYKEGFYFLNEVLKDKNLIKDYNYEILVYNYHLLRMRLGYKKNILNYFLNDLNNIKTINDPVGYVLTCTHISEYYTKFGNIKEANKFDSIALSSALKSKNKIALKWAYESLASAKTDDAPKYLQKYIRLTDSLQIAERKNADRFARIELETDEIINEKNLAIKQKWLYSSIILALFIIAILLYINKNQKTANKQIMLQNQFQKANETIYKLMLDQQELINSSKYKEKKRIAFELHDTIINKLVGVRINLAALQKNPNTETIQNSIKHINAIQSIEEDVRNIVYDLSNETIINSDYVEIIKNQLEDFNETAISITIHNDHEIDWTQINSEVKLNLLKIIKESFKNAQKHAQANTFSITFTLDEKNLCLAINNNGQGFDVVNTKFGVGLKSINQRINSLNGSIKINSSQKEGTIMFIAIPV